jgi:hypothetical protein
VKEYEVIGVSLLTRVTFAVDDDATPQEVALFGPIPDKQMRAMVRQAKASHPALWRTLKRLDDKQFDAFRIEWLEEAISCEAHTLHELESFKLDLRSIRDRLYYASHPHPVPRRVFIEPEDRISAPQRRLPVSPTFSRLSDIAPSQNNEPCATAAAALPPPEPRNPPAEPKPAPEMYLGPKCFGHRRPAIRLTQDGYDPAELRSIRSSKLESPQ